MVASVPVKRSLFDRGWRYTLVGLACAVANYVIIVTISYFGGHYLLGMLVSYLIVAPLGYVMHIRFTFAEPFKLSALMRFAGAVASTYPIGVALMVLLCSVLDFSVAIGTLITTAILFGWNFVAAHWAIIPQLKLLSGILKPPPAGSGK